MSVVSLTLLESHVPDREAWRAEVSLGDWTASAIGGTPLSATVKLAEYLADERTK